MQLGIGTLAALSVSVFIFIFAAFAFAETQEIDSPSSPWPAQNQLRHPASQPILPKPQQEEIVKPKRLKKYSDDTQLYMEAKLASSQKVLEGLVTENFALIGEGAKKMKKISEAANWPHTVDEVYQHYSVSFRNQCDKLAEQAERHDLQAAHYTYLHMSTTCIDCHKYVRGRFRVEQPKKGGPVHLIPTRWDGPTTKRPSVQPDKDQR